MTSMDAARRGGATMCRTGRILAALTVGLCVLFAPTAVAEPTPPTVAGVVRAQAPPPPGPDLRNDQQARPPSKDQVVVGVGGILLIGLVFLSRRMRKKPVFFFHWKKQ